MVHLLTAYKYNSNASMAFWIGNIAPDSVGDWKEKDKTHFRDKPDRLNALRELAFTMNLSDDFCQGILLHLFLDYYWDSYPLCNFIENCKDGNWFQIYRHEIALAGAWLFHHTEWSKTVWDEMIACPISVYENVHGIIKEDVADFIIRNSKWYAENGIGPSSAFTPEFIEEFTSKVAIDFKNWLDDFKSGKPAFSIRVPLEGSPSMASEKGDLNMYTKTELIDKLKYQLAIEYNCTKQDFSRSENVITAPAKNEGRRQYISGTFFLQMVTLGQNAVITADECLHPWLKEYVKDKTGNRLFEHTNLCDIDVQLKKYSKRLWQTHHMFLPNMNIALVSELAPIKWHEQNDIHKFYEENLFPNALCSEFLPERPDMLAVTAYDGDTIIGMAGCSADTSNMWQIGIDIHEKYRGKGLGTYLVTLLKNEVIQRGKIPFYGTSLSNLHSWSIALNSGFFPAWVEVETIES